MLTPWCPRTASPGTPATKPVSGLAGAPGGTSRRNRELPRLQERGGQEAACKGNSGARGARRDCWGQEVRGGERGRSRAQLGRSQLLGPVAVSSAGSTRGVPRAGGPPRGPQGTSKARRGAEERSVEAEGSVDVGTDWGENRATGLAGHPGQRGGRGMEAEAAWAWGGGWSGCGEEPRDTTKRGTGPCRVATA